MAEAKEEAKSTEYPKSLHKGGDRTATERVVKDEDEEAAAREDGFKTIHEAEAKEEPKAEPKSKKAK